MAEATAVTPPSATKPSRFSGLGQKILVPVLAVFTALVIGGLIIWISGGNPLEAYRGLMEGAFGSPKAISETLIWSTPYIFAGLAVALAFKGGLFNIGAEGQLALGALAAAWLGYGLPKALGTTIPAIIHVPICVVGRRAGRRSVGRHPRLAQGPLRRARSDQHDHDELHRAGSGVVLAQRPDERSQPDERHRAHAANRRNGPHRPIFRRSGCCACTGARCWRSSWRSWCGSCCGRRPSALKFARSAPAAEPRAMRASTWAARSS